MFDSPEQLNYIAKFCLFFDNSESQNSRSTKIKTRELILNPHYVRFETRIYSTWFPSAPSVDNVSFYCKDMGCIIVIIHHNSTIANIGEV